MEEGVYIFILWENARFEQDKILSDIDDNFTILETVDIEWSQDKFSNNISRFYGEKLPDRSHKERHCGRGGFLLVVVYDRLPVMTERETSKGNFIVNGKMFDLKDKFRKWTGGGHKIHCSNNIHETRHDLSLLFGVGAEKYYKFPQPTKNIYSLSQDLVGADGWESFEQLFYVINNTCNYVVLRNFEDFPVSYTLDSHNDIDFMTDSDIDLRSIVNGREVFNKRYRVHDKFNVGTDEVLADFRFVGDGYYDQKWQVDILKNKTLDARGFYKPDAQNYFFSLGYHALIHKRKFGKDYAIRLKTLFDKLSLDSIENKFNLEEEFVFLALKDFMKENSYSFTEPKDKSVYFNKKFVGVNNITIKRHLITEFKDFVRPLKSPIRLVKDILLFSKELFLRLIWRLK